MLSVKCLLTHEGPGRSAARLLAALAVLGCATTPTPDASLPADIDAGSDAGSDAGHDAFVRPDAGPLPSCGNATPLALSQCIDSARYQTDLEAIAMPRVPASPHWQAVQDLCASRLTSLGFAVERHTYETGVNVIGVRAGTADATHEVLLGAHYDHIAGCDGADDNATGVAATLELARVLTMASYPRTLVVACWDEEERGLVGSRAYATRAMARGELIDASFTFDMIGYTNDAPNSQTLPGGFSALFRAQAAEVAANENRADFIAVIADPMSSTAATSLETYADRIGLPFVPILVPASLLDSPLIADLRRSDQASFWDRGYPGVFITDTSEFRYAAYHCRGGPDVVANLSQHFGTLVASMTVAGVAQALGLSQ